MKENREKKWKKKKWKKIKNGLKNNKLFLYVFLNLFNLFFSIILKLNKFKMHKILTNFNDILFSLVLFIVKPNIRKSFFLTFVFSFFSTFWNQTWPKRDYEIIRKRNWKEE